MRPIVTDRVAWSVGLSVTIMSHAKTVEPIEIQFGLWTRVGPRNRVLDGGPDSTGKYFSGDSAVHCKEWELPAVSCAKTAEPIEMPFGICT